MRRARRPARSGGIPTSRGSSREADLVKLVALQTRLLDRAAALLKPGGTLVYCTCSLEPEEGEEQIAALLGRNPALRRSPIRPTSSRATANS